MREAREEEGEGLLFSSWRKLPVQILVVVAKYSHERSVSCEQQLDMGLSILKDTGVPHSQALPRILKGNGLISSNQDVDNVRSTFQN